MFLLSCWQDTDGPSFGGGANREPGAPTYTRNGEKFDPGLDGVRMCPEFAPPPESA